MTESANILTTIKDEVGWLTLNRPQYRNAINREMWDAIPNSLSQLQESGARVIVICGEGTAFAAGADLFELTSLKDETMVADHWGAMRAALTAVTLCSVPTIAMIAGPCMGGGCLLAVSCDMRFAEPSARFCVPLSKLGIAIDQENIRRLSALVGRGLAAEMLYCSATVSATRAEKIGLVNEVVPHHDLERTVRQNAALIVQNSAGSIILLKSSLQAIGLRDSFNEDQSAVIATYLTDDFRSRVKRATER